MYHVRVVLRGTVVGSSDWCFNNLSESHHHWSEELLLRGEGGGGDEGGGVYGGSRVLVGLFYRDVVGCETQVPQVSQSVGNVGS